MTVRYEVRWGDEPSQTVTLQSGHRRTHSHRLDSAGRAPTPHIHFFFVVASKQQVPLIIGGLKGYRMSFFQSIFGGFGPITQPARPKPYQFVLSPDQRTLDVRTMP